MWSSREESTPVEVAVEQVERVLRRRERREREVKSRDQEIKGSRGCGVVGEQEWKTVT